VVDPDGQALERRGIEVHGAALGGARACNESSVLQDLDVFGDRLLGEGEGLGELVDGGVAA